MILSKIHQKFYRFSLTRLYGLVMYKAQYLFIISEMESTLFSKKLVHYHLLLVAQCVFELSNKRYFIFVCYRFYCFFTHPPLASFIRS